MHEISGSGVSLALTVLPTSDSLGSVSPVDLSRSIVVRRTAGIGAELPALDALRSGKRCPIPAFILVRALSGSRSIRPIKKTGRVSGGHAVFCLLRVFDGLDRAR
jgi:hypothetical protein